MIVSHEWLKTFVPHNLSPQEVGDLLSQHTVTLDGIESSGADLSAFVVGLVVQAARHPNSERLSVTKVDDGSGELLDVVCGAQNIVVGAKYPFARTGTLMPAGITIEKRKIRGETSNGMLCSASELALGEDSDGILQLDTNAAPGTPLLDVLKTGDARLNLDVLPNRPDLLSHRGVAREISSITGEPLNPLPGEIVGHGPGGETHIVGGGGAISNPAVGQSEAAQGGVTVRIEDAHSCPHYYAVIIRGVTVGPSPAWLRTRLESIGVRSISNVVDFTNYILHGYGQPVHAFDLGKLAGSSIVVRPTRAGEKLVTLDGVERKIATGTTVICDGERPVALAGIMGGRDSEVTDSTTDLLIEIASFEPRFVRKVRRSVGLSTDASYRYERGTDNAALQEIAAQVVFMLDRIAGGTFGGWISVGTPPATPAAVVVRPERVSHLIGVQISFDECARFLSALGCTVKVHVSNVGDDDSANLQTATPLKHAPTIATLEVTPPSWRNDLNVEVDFIEEIARLKGFNALPDELRATRPGNVPDHPLYSVGRQVRDLLVTAGLAETRPMPFTKTGDESLRVRNPLAEDEPYLRQSLLDTLARRAEFNLSRMQGNIRLFEIGNAFVANANRLPREEVRAGALIMGLRRPPHFTEPHPPAFDMWDAKELASSMVKAAFPPGLALMSAGEGDVLWEIKTFDGNDVGRVVRVTLEKPVWASEAFGVELTLGLMPSTDVAAAGRNVHGKYVPILPDAIRDAEAYAARLEADQATLAKNWREEAGALPLAAPGAHAKYKPIPSTPAAEFDLALLVPDSVSSMEVWSVLKITGGDLLENVVLFDEFRGPGVPDGTRSLAWRLTFRHPERTLKEKEIEGRRISLLETLNRKLGIKPRAS